MSMYVGTEKIESSDTVKLLDITFHNKLKFEKHISKICNKVSHKLHALARISNYMTSNKLQAIMKAFIESQFGYCPLIWMFHSRNLNNRINRLHERGLRIVYKDRDVSYDELLEKDSSFPFIIETYKNWPLKCFKVNNNLSPTFMKNIFTESSNSYNLRTQNPYKSYNVHSVYNGTETISFRGPKTWELVPDNIKKAKSLLEFKSKINIWKPVGCTCRLCKIYIPNTGFI